jgi:hypothetical protein
MAFFPFSFFPGGKRQPGPTIAAIQKTTVLLWRQDQVTMVENQKSRTRSRGSRIKNQESRIKNQESRIKNQESGIRNQESGMVTTQLTILGQVVECTFNVPVPVLLTPGSKRFWESG